MSRDVVAVVEGILPQAHNDNRTIIVITIPTEHAHGIERDDIVTLNIKEPA